MLAAGRAFLLTESHAQPDLLLCILTLCPYQLLIKQRDMKTVKCSSQPQYKKRISLNYTQLVTAIVIIMYSGRNQIAVAIARIVGIEDRTKERSSFSLQHLEL